MNQKYQDKNNQTKNSRTQNQKNQNQGWSGVHHFLNTRTILLDRIKDFGSGF